MFRAFDLVDGVIRERDADDARDLASAMWIDAHDPDDDERARLEAVIGAPLPSVEPAGIETSARCYVDATGLHLRATFLSEHAGRHQTATVACLLQPERLLTIRPERLRDFRILRARSRRGQVESNSAEDLLLDLFEQKIDRFGELLETTHKRLEDLGRSVLEEQRDGLHEAISEIARIEDSNSKIQLALTDTRRSASFLQRQLHEDAESVAAADEIVRDAGVLLAHSTFLFERINFLMATTQGFVNIEQNKIIKMFSIAAVVFLPPTLVASIYGMNFERIPELGWDYGYLFALVLMVAAGIAPYWYFRRKGWL